MRSPAITAALQAISDSRRDMLWRYGLLSICVTQAQWTLHSLPLAGRQVEAAPGSVVQDQTAFLTQPRV